MHLNLSIHHVEQSIDYDDVMVFLSPTYSQIPRKISICDNRKSTETSILGLYVPIVKVVPIRTETVHERTETVHERTETVHERTETVHERTETVHKWCKYRVCPIPYIWAIFPVHAPEFAAVFIT